MFLGAPSLEATPGHFRENEVRHVAYCIRILPVLLFGCKVDHLAEEISKQSVRCSLVPPSTYSRKYKERVCSDMFRS